MNRLMKFGVVAAALAAFTAFAQEAAPVVAADAPETVDVAEPEDVATAEPEEEPLSSCYEDGVNGWSPILLGIATPVQLPIGTANWDIRGLAVSIAYTDLPKMYGVDVTFGVTMTREEMYGIEISGVGNWNRREAGGIRGTFFANVSNGAWYGLEFGSVSLHHEFYGFDAELGASICEKGEGWQNAFVTNIAKDYMHGVQMAMGANIAPEFYGCQIAGIYNQTDYLRGAQIGLVNYARECPFGFQIGLINIISDNMVPALPIFNCYFGD